MKFSKTKALDKILAMKKRIKIIQGGSSAGKTIATLLLLIDLAQQNEDLFISVVSETMPHLKRGAIRDFLNIMEGHNYFKQSQWNRTDYIYTFESGSKIEFFSADSSDKVRGPRRDVLFVNECNNINYETYTQLAIRTKGDIYLDYNPVAEFWAITELKHRDDTDFTILTYKDNDALPQTIIDEIESRKDNVNFWKVYGLGELGETEGKIFKDWNIIDQVPHSARLEVRGLDFGYTNDPSCLVAVYKHDGGFILDEELYMKGMSNKRIADTILNQDNASALVKADAAEPKSIDEIKSYGVNIMAAPKGPGSVLQGIQFVQDQRISVTKRSTNIIKEYRNYLWITDKDGIIQNKPEHAFSHSMDAIRYALSGYKPRLKKKAYQPNFSSYQNKLRYGR